MEENLEQAHDSRAGGHADAGAEIERAPVVDGRLREDRQEHIKIASEPNSDQAKSTRTCQSDASGTTARSVGDEV